MKKYDKLILILLVAVFGAGIFFTARSAFSSYVTFEEAAASGRNVQVKGVAVEGTLRELEGETFSFELKDVEGGAHRVVHTGTIPVNLFEVDYVVVQGRYTEEEFLANKILVKCPSKYQVEEN